VERVPAAQNSVSIEGRFLTRAEFHRLAGVPPETEWFANLDNENTRRAYRDDVGDFIRFTCYALFWRRTFGRTVAAVISAI
jgi:hypothetical protein